MESQSIVHSDGREEASELQLLHYNDVYHVEAGSREPVGGIARFQTLCNQYREGAPNLLTLFSGDAFNPSLESSVTKGSHMVPLLNNIGTDVACVGNHDLDFGISHFRHLAEQCTFPWLLANVLDPALGDDVPMANAKKTAMLTSNGVKVGVIGIVEREWLDTLNQLPPNLNFLPAADVVQEHAKALRDQGAQMIIVLSHQREPNDIKLAQSVPAGTIDLMLGGHDHFYSHSTVNGCHLLRSGTDFKQLSYLEAWHSKHKPQGWDYRITRRDITSAIPQDPQTMSLVNDMTSSLRSKLDKPIGYTAAPLDARFTTVRLKESNLGNFVCDLMRVYYNTDCTIMAGGTIRGDQVYPPGILKVADIMNCFPFEDPCVVLRVTGDAIRLALENSVSTYPALEGRFPQVAGLKFTFDANKPPMDRIQSISIADSPIEPERKYTLATRAYMAHGKDGFHSLLMVSEGGAAEEIVEEENGMLISALLRQYFMSLKVMGRWKGWGKGMSRVWGNVQEDLHQTHPVRGSRVSSPEISAHINQHDSTSKARAGEVQQRKQQEEKGLVGGLGAAAHGGDQHQGSDLVSNALKQSAHSANNARTHSDAIHTSDSEDDDHPAADLPTVAPSHISNDERLKIIARKACRKWWRAARMKGHPGTVEEEAENEEGAKKFEWTRGIAPKVEGRIIILNSVEDK